MAETVDTSEDHLLHTLFPRLMRDACAALVSEVITALDRRLVDMMPIATAQERCMALAGILEALGQIAREQGHVLAAEERHYG